MRKVIFSLLFFTLTAKAEVDPSWVSTCGSISKMQALVAQYTIMPVTMPIPPFTGITIGMIQQNSVIQEICDLVENLSKADTLTAIDLTKNTLNRITNNKWMDKLGFDNDQFEFVRDKFVAPEADVNRGVWMRESTHNTVNFIGARLQDKYQQDKINKESVEQKDREDAKRRELAESAQNVAVLRDAIKCPVAENQVNYTKIYKDTIKPNQDLMDDSDLDVNFFYDKLKEIGSKLASDEGMIIRYNRELEKLKSAGSYMQRSNGTYQDTKMSISTTKGVKTRKSTPVTKKYYNYSVKETEELYTHFKEDYDQLFKKYLRYMYLTDTAQFGLFDGAAERVEKTLREISFECSQRRLMKGYDREKEDYNSEYDKRREECNISLKFSEKGSETLFSKYVDELKSALMINKKANAAIWTAESRYLGIHRVSSSNDSNNVVAQNETSCETNFTQKEMEAIKLKTNAEIGKLRQQSAEAATKRTTFKQMKAQNDKDMVDEFKKRQKFKESTNKTQEDAMIQPIGISPIRSQLNKK